MTSILIADDHPFFRAGVSAMLTTAGHQIVGTVDDGDAALDAIAEVNPDVVILDIRMPGRDGVKTLEAMRARNDRRPVIVLATEIMDDQLVAIMRAGVNAILFKDQTEDALLEAIGAVREGARHIDGALLDKAFHIAALRSPRERQVAEAVAAGKRNRDVAVALGMTEGTVKVFLHKIYAKLSVANRTESSVLMQSRAPD